MITCLAIVAMLGILYSTASHLEARSVFYGQLCTSEVSKKRCLPCKSFTSAGDRAVDHHVHKLAGTISAILAAARLILRLGRPTMWI
jgi:hypothetical protein